jgi:hypothetical protein
MLCELLIRLSDLRELRGEVSDEGLSTTLGLARLCSRFLRPCRGTGVEARRLPSGGSGSTRLRFATTSLWLLPLPAFGDADHRATYGHSVIVLAVRAEVRLKFALGLILRVGGLCLDVDGLSALVRLADSYTLFVSLEWKGKTCTHIHDCTTYVLRDMARRTSFPRRDKECT